MPYLFDHLDAIRHIVDVSPLGLITDIDGTISEIVPCPDKATVSAVCRQRLAVLAKKLSLVAAISGRPASVARDMLGVDGVVYVGNHGLEQWRNGVVHYVEGLSEYPSKVVAAIEKLKELLSEEGILFENKGLSLSIHYRNSPDRECTRNLIIENLAASAVSRDFRIHTGKMVIELRPPVDVNKGTAVEALVGSYKLKGGIYLGDDITDVDAFAALRRLRFRGVTVAVIGEDSPRELETESDFTLNGVHDVELFLTWLADVASPPR